MNTMNKTIIGLIVFLLFSTSNINAQSLNDYKLNGKVKSFYKKTYENSKDGYLDTITPSEYVFVDLQNRKETEIHKKNERANISVKYYDENRNCILDSAYTKRDYVEITKFYYDLKGKRLKDEIYCNDSIQSITTYKYDISNNLVEEFTDHNGKSSHRVLLTYDSNKNHTSTYSYHNDVEFSSYVIEYNKKGLKIKDYSPEENNNYKIYEYDKRGNLIKEIEYYDDKYRAKTIYVYNSENKLTNKKSYFENELSSSITYIYDSSNRIIQTIKWEEKSYITDNKETVRFDKKGRILERKIYRVAAPPMTHKFKYENNNLVQEIYDEPTDSYNQSHKIDYFYNQDNTLSRKVRYSYIDGVGKKIKWKEDEIEEYYYNSEKQNNFIKTTRVYPYYISNDSLIYKNGLLIKRFDCDKNKHQTIYKYDEIGRLIDEDLNGYDRRRKIYKYNNDTLIYQREEIYTKDTLNYCIIDEWKYDSNKRLIECIYNHPHFSSKTNYFYNSNGKLKKTIYKDNEGRNITSRYKYKLFSKDYKIVYSDNSNIENVYYKYDDKGNLIEERHPSYLVRFEYEYYK